MLRVYTSLLFILVAGSSITGEPSTPVLKESQLMLPSQVEKASMYEIKSAHANLINTIRQKLNEVNPDMTTFYLHIVTLFESDDIPDLFPDKEKRTIDLIFTRLTEKKMWNFGNTTPLRMIVDNFIEAETHTHSDIIKMICEYNLKLNGYRANSKIVENLRQKQYKLESTPSREYDAEFRKNLSLILFSDSEEGVILEMQSMKFIQKVWEKFSIQFELTLEAVLHQIVENCIEVQWFIPSQSAQKILDHLSGAVEFLQENFISDIVLEGDVIYNNSSGVASAKVLLYGDNACSTNSSLKY